MVEALLPGPITFTPAEHGGAPRFELSGSIATGAMFIYKGALLRSEAARA